MKKAFEQVKKIFKLAGHETDSLKDANLWAQKNLLRTGERWDKQEGTLVRELIVQNQNALVNLLRDLNFIDEIKPKYKKYEYALIMGALKPRVEMRLDYLANLLTQGYDFEYVVLLGGQRALQDSEKKDFPENINTEVDMMLYLFNNNDVLKNKKLIIVDASMVTKEDGSTVRPTTDDTIRHFVKLAPQRGSCLVVSNNPYVVRQAKVTERILGKDFSVDCAGLAINLNNFDILLIMDEFARTVYEEYQKFLLSK